MYLRLSVLMLLQWAVPGSLIPLYSLRLQELGFAPLTLAICCSTQAVAGVVSSLVAGQVADRWLSAEKAMALCAALSGVSLWMISCVHDPLSLFLLTLVFWLVTGPMLLLGTTICFSHLPIPERQFGPIRLWGTIGWMVMSWAMGHWLARPEWLALAREWITWPSPTPLDDVPRLGAVVAFLLAGYTLTLPHTPPRPATGSRWLAPLAAFQLMRDRAFLAYLICVLGVCITIPFSTQNAPLLLRQLGIPQPRIAPTLSLAQLTEILFLAMQPVLLRQIGVRVTMGLGLAAWLIAFGVFALGEPTWLVVASLGLHGLFITGFLITGQVYLNRLATGDTRASVQGLFTFVNGLGLLLGNLLAGWLRDLTGGKLPATFAVAACVIAASLALFLVSFRQPPGEIEGPNPPAAS